MHAAIPRGCRAAKDERAGGACSGTAGRSVLTGCNLKDGETPIPQGLLLSPNWLGRRTARLHSWRNNSLWTRLGRGAEVPGLQPERREAMEAHKLTVCQAMRAGRAADPGRTNGERRMVVPHRP